MISISQNIPHQSTIKIYIPPLRNRPKDIPPFSSVRFNLEQIQIEGYAISLVSVINFRKPFQNGLLLEIRIT